MLVRAHINIMFSLSIIHIVMTFLGQDGECVNKVPTISRECGLDNISALSDPSQFTTVQARTL